MESKAFKKFYFYVCILFANLLGIIAGMTLSWSSPIIPKLQKDNADNPIGEAISDSETSWIGGLLSLGAVFGPFMAAFASEKFGRRWALFCIVVPFVTTYFLQAFAETVWLFLLSRTVAGLSIGGVFTVLPLYVTELCPDKIRGILGGLMNTFIVSGVMLSYVIGPYISILWFNIICGIMATSVGLIFLFVMPETPQWLVSKGRESEAKEILTKLRTDASVESIEEEFNAIRDIVRENSGGSIRDFKKRGNIKALTVSVSMLAFQQFSGINVVQMYAQKIFDASGSTIPADVSPIIIGGVQVIASFITPALADRTGRRFLFILSAAGMLVAEVPLGVYFYLKDDGEDVTDIGWLPLLCLVVYMIMYNCGMGALPWLIMAEVFPPNIKGMASSISASSCWFFSFILTKFFDDVTKEIGMAGAFWIFAGFNALEIIFVITYLPETKGKSQKEIQQMLNS